MSRETFDHEYPPGDWDADAIAETLREHPAALSLPSYDDAEAWESLADDPLTKPVVEEALATAAETSGEAVPPLPATRYLECHRTGNRTNYQDAASERRSRLSTFALAECFDREGAYRDDVLDYAWAICEESTWLLPAHLNSDGPQGNAGLPVPVADENRDVALQSTETAQLLGELVFVLGDRLHPALRERIRHEVDTRVLTPYEARDDIWWLDRPTNNWNAVCNAGVAIAALSLLEDPDRQANIVSKAARSLDHYLADFDPDGCTSEGIDYWNYGFGNYVEVAAALDARTAGKYSLLSPPIVDRIAQYPLRIELSPDRFVPFSDATEDSRIDPFPACYLGDRLDIPGLAARGRREFETSGAPAAFGRTLRTLQQVRQAPTDLPVPTPPHRSHFTGYDWWISRADPADPDGLVAAVKGGHNGEPHNHNDLGSVVIHARGESLLTDLGAPVYDADFFSDRRHEYLVARSLGHSVPFVNGAEQAAGDDRVATVVDRTDSQNADSFALDISGAYPDDAGLSSLVRTVTLDRTQERVQIRDEATFDGQATGDGESASADDSTGDDNVFTEVLVSYFPLRATEEGIEVTGENGRATAEIDPAPTDVAVEKKNDAVRGRDVWRARLSFQTEAQIAVTLDVGPE